jgi:hypothetical protein
LLELDYSIDKLSRRHQLQTIAKEFNEDTFNCFLDLEVSHRMAEREAEQRLYVVRTLAA